MSRNTSSGNFALFTNAPALGIGADLNGLSILSSTSLWNTPVDNAALDPGSSTTIAACGPTHVLHPNFGAALQDSTLNGVPYMVVPASQTLVPITFTTYAAFSDAGPYPLPPNTPIEGYGAPDFSNFDAHVLILQQDPTKLNGFGTLYELFGTSIPTGYPTESSGWTAQFGCKFNPNGGDLQRTQGTTSADAAGLPIFPSLVRYDEVLHAIAGPGYIPHAFGFAFNSNFTSWFTVPPAQHVAGPNVGTAPFGMRVRLKSSWSQPGGWSAVNTVITNTLKKYGMILNDNAGTSVTSWYLGGCPDSRWDDSDLHLLQTNITGTNFEVVFSGTPVAGTP
jgi:hypothetical protein